jgi:hypothetical protein
LREKTLFWAKSLSVLAKKGQIGTMAVPMDIQLATLCDSAMDYNGKLCVLGTFDTIGSRQLPVVHQNCALALRVLFRPEDEGTHTLSLRIVDADGKPAMPDLPPVQFDVRLPQDIDFITRNMVLHFQALQFTSAGVFNLEVGVDGTTRVALPLRVIYVAQEGQAEA